jgi:hypothetical protein
LLAYGNLRQDELTAKRRVYQPGIAIAQHRLEQDAAGKFMQTRSPGIPNTKGKQAAWQRPSLNILAMPVSDRSPAMGANDQISAGFRGDEDPFFNSLPTNELMISRGVGNLRPEPRDEYGSHATFNSDVLLAQHTKP